MPTPWPHALSGAALDLDPPPVEGEAPSGETPNAQRTGAPPPSAQPVQRPSPLDLSEAARYSTGGVLGRGGMGEVRAVWDARLGREVAEKTVYAESESAGTRLLREATVTARLEHPNIVPVYDAGRTDDGRPCYRMRLLRGRSLAERLAPTAPLRTRLQTVRAFLQACEAVAYAHARGILHRDLKPGNIMLGERGETLVVDWGLACDLDAHGHGPAQTVGTPGYMAPEQAAGAPLDVRADIWSLGAVLHFILTGQPPPATGPHLPPDAPPALAAIIVRALQPDPTDRYDTADDLVEDLVAWFEGRRVAAYHTTHWRAVRHLVRARKVPITVALIGTVLVVLAVVNGWQTTLTERNLAVAARREAVAARDRAQKALGSAWVSQARIAEDQGDQRRAELLAVDALLHLPNDPDARGVLVRFAGRSRPSLFAQTPLPGCRTAALDPTAQHVACVAGEAVTLHDRTTGTTLPLVGPAEAVGFAGDAERVVGVHGGRPHRWDAHAVPIPSGGPVAGVERIVSGSQPARALLLGHGNAWQVDGDVVRALDICVGASGASHLTTTTDGHLLATCTDLRVTLGAASPPLHTFQLPESAGPVMALATSGSGTALRVAVGTVSGQVQLLDHQLRPLRTLAFSGGAIRRLALADGRLAVATARGWVEVLELDAHSAPVRLPGPALDLAWSDAARRLHVVTHDAATTWALGPAAAPDHFELGAGIASLSTGPTSGAWVASLGDGRAVAVDGAGNTTQTLHPHSSVAKDAAWSPNGEWLAVGHATRTLLEVFSATTGERVHTRPVPKVRRLVWLTDGPLLAATYAPGLRAWSGPQLAAHPLTGAQPGLVADMERSTDGRVALVLDQTGTVFRSRPEDPTHLDVVTVHPTAVAIAGTERLTLIADRDRVTIWDGPTSRQLPLGVNDILEVAVSPDGSRFATAHLDGQVQVWASQDGRLLARLRGHRARAVALVFRNDGNTLVSGSWDQTVRTWDLRVLDRSPDQLATELHAAWGTLASTAPTPN